MPTDRVVETAAIRSLPLVVAALALLAGLAASRLSPHEAIWAESARAMIASGDWLVPTLDGRPWLEKPPLGTWLIAALGWARGGVGEWAARFPSTLAAMGLCLGVSSLAARRFGPSVGVLAGCVQAVTPWLIVRGRLAEADILLAALVVAALAAFDRVRTGATGWRWPFFAAIGLSALVKGIGFGAALALASVLVVLAWDRDRRTLRALASPVGIAAAVLVAMAWPLRVLARYPEALGLWTLHITDRMAARSSHFAGEGWAEYLGTPMVQTLPWTPLIAFGAWHSWKRAKVERGGPDRLLWAWATVPSAMVSMASARNGHYLIHALPPLSIWGALGLRRLGQRLLDRRGWSEARLRRSVACLFAGLGASWAIGFLALGPRLNQRDAEFAFYERAATLLPRTEPLILLYDLERDGGWDKAPYPTPFGPVPADLAARLFHLDRPASWRRGPDDLRDRPPRSSRFGVIGRERDRASLERIGVVEALAIGPTNRWDRAFVLFEVRGSVASRGTAVGVFRPTAPRAGRDPGSGGGGGNPPRGGSPSRRRASG